VHHGVARSFEDGAGKWHTVEACNGHRADLDSVHKVDAPRLTPNFLSPQDALRYRPAETCPFLVADAAPDTGEGIVGQGVFEAFRLYQAGVTDGPSSLQRLSIAKEEGLWDSPRHAPLRRLRAPSRRVRPLITAGLVGGSKSIPRPFHSKGLEAERNLGCGMDFDRFSIAVLTTRRDGRTADDQDSGALQDAHMTHLANLHDDGHLLAAGPVGDSEIRGLLIFACGVEETRELLLADPAVRARRFNVTVAPWMVPGGAMAFFTTNFPRSMAETQ
jgi:uncharacterized protein YciI